MQKKILILNTNTNMLYLIKLKNTNYIKVGYSKNPKNRLKQYKTSLPNDLIEFFITKEGDIKDESYYRDKYRKYKTKGNSEWLELPNNIIEELIKDFNKGQTLEINKLSKEKWYEQNVENLIKLCSEGYFSTEAAMKLNCLNWDWVSYANKRFLKEYGHKLTGLRPKKKTKKEELIEEANVLYRSGLSINEISIKIGRSENIIKKYLNL